LRLKRTAEDDCLEGSKDSLTISLFLPFSKIISTRLEPTIVRQRDQRKESRTLGDLNQVFPNEIDLNTTHMEVLEETIKYISPGLDHTTGISRAIAIDIAPFIPEQQFNDAGAVTAQIDRLLTHLRQG
jgi:hypothetical protein